MALLIRCQSCKGWFSQDKSHCPKCETPWDEKGKPKAFYHDFTLYGVRRRVKTKAKNLHYAKVENDKFNPEEWWEEREKKRNEEKCKIPTFSDAIPFYLEWCEFQGCGKRGPNRERTLVSKRNSFNNHLSPYLGKKKVDSITDQDIFNFIVQETGRREPESINLDLKYLRTFLSWCVERGYGTENPMRRISLLEEKDPRSDLRFQDWEVSLLVKALDSRKIPAHKSDILMALLMTGLRAYSEIARAEWSWYDPESETLTVPAGRTKGKKAIRKVLSSRMANLLNRRMLNKNPECPYIFPNPDTGKPYTDFRKLVKNVCKEAGIKRWEEVSPRWFRHNYLSWGGALGYSAERLQETVGHANASTTLHYTHLYDVERRKVEDSICENLLTGRVQNRVHKENKKGDQPLPTA